VTELKDYSGEFIPNVRYEDFSKEFLARLLIEYGRCYIMADALWYTAVKERFGREVANALDYEMWVNRFPPFETARILSVLNLKNRDVADAMKFWQLAAMMPHGMFDYEIDLKSNNHAILTIKRCPALIRFETKEPEMIEPICQVMELASARAYANEINPNIVVTMPKMPPRKSPDEICCQFEFKLEPKV
jgi:hypothetical protein